MIGPLVIAAVLAGRIDRADIAVVVIIFIIADVAGAVLHDGPLDVFNAGSGNPDGILHMADVILIGIPAVQTGTVDRTGPAVG